MSGVRVVGDALGDVGRNDPCPCGSGRKFKHCCQAQRGQAGHPAGPGRASADLEQRLQALALAARMMPPDRFTEVEYETLIADREAETRRLVAFCGLDWDDACLIPERNTRLINTASRWQARQPVYTTSVQRWRRYEPWLGELRELLPAALQPSTGSLPRRETVQDDTTREFAMRLDRSSIMATRTSSPNQRQFESNWRQ